MSSNLYDEFSLVATPLPTPERVLTIGAHPDDAEFGAGATLSRWADEGADVTMCITTDGSKGSWDPSERAADLIERRKAEQAASGEVMGATSFVHLGHVDGELEASMKLRLQFAKIIRTTKPDYVLTHDPWQRYQMHPDHRATGISAVDAVVSAREPLAMLDSDLAAHRPIALLLWSADAPDHAEEVTDAYAQRKLEALLHHSSQVHTTMGDASDGAQELAAFRARIHEWHVQAGAPFGVGPAEVFKRLTP
ncbi:MAG: PIG-L deacetylase family protein [Acidimicrobiia bacterium]